jgi:leucyl aminopeptidase
MKRYGLNKWINRTRFKGGKALKIRVKQESMEHVQDEIIAVGLFEEMKRLRGAAAEADRHTGRMVKEVLASGDFKGKLYQTLLLYVKKGLKTKRLLLVGLGKEKEFTIDKLRGASASAARQVRDMGLKSFVMPGSFVPSRRIAFGEQVRAFVEGILLGLYKFDEYKSPEKNSGKKQLRQVSILVNAGPELRQARKEVKRTEAVVRAVYMARDLVSRPGNSATPRFLANAARQAAKKSGLVCRVLDEKAAEKQGMGSFLSVSRGTDEPARFIVLEHKPRQKKAAATVVLVGKAITFDSGGISLKPAANMEEMKMDMSGGAAVLGALQAAAELKLPLHVVGLVPATENLPSGHALKPGDIVKSMSGKTIEIISTDAEGRLILADALHYAQRYKPSAIIDLATLTGACIIALGNDVSAVMGSDEHLVGRIKQAGAKTGEKVWQLPLWEEYGELIKSDIADLKNVGGRSAGTITAGFFLKEFAGDFPWAHLDIAGTAWAKKDQPCIPKGATGVGVRLLIEMLENWEK